MNLHTVSVGEIQNFGRQFLGQQFPSFEQAADNAVRRIHSNFKGNDGQPLFSLVRIFRICTYAELLPELRAEIDPSHRQYLALMGTVGREEAWCSRRKSQAHQVIPLGSTLTPMLKAAFEQIGLFSDTEQQSDLQIEITNWIECYFYVPTALGSPHIPAQDEFVKPYGIQSVIGMGTPFKTGAACLCLCFARESITAEESKKFIEITPFLMAMLSTNEKPDQVWG